MAIKEQSELVGCLSVFDYSAGRRAPGFLKLLLSGKSVCVCVCVSAPEAMNN